MREKPMEAVFSMQSIPKLYNENQRSFMTNKPILSSERMLHKDYDRKGSVPKRNL
jgi:hypothetical protein